jgi:hypothetical protein
VSRRSDQVKARDSERSARKRGDRNKRAGDRAAEVRELWFTISRRPWATLVMIPAHEGGSALGLAHELVEVGSALRRRPVELISAEGIDLTTSSGWLFDALSGRIGARALEANAGSGTSQPPRCERIVVLEPIAANSMSVPVAQAADAVLLVVEQGVTDFSSARATLKAIGRERFVGCALITP